MRNENSVQVMIGDKQSKKTNKTLGAKHMANDSLCVKLISEWFGYVCFMYT